MFNKEELFFKRAALIFFICLFTVACFIFTDYGIYWDEGVQWTQIGALNYNYIRTGNSAELLSNFHRYYGPSYEIVLFAAEKLFDLTDARHIFMLRHGICFLTFFIAVLCFYFLCLKIFKRHALSLLGCLMLVLSPRIFADSFYNSKDLSMLCFCIISAYTMYLFIEKQTIFSAFIHALLCGFAVDIRIMAILLPIATVYFFFLQKERKIIPLLVFIAYSLFFIMAFWPVLWLDPVQNFIEAFKQMSNYPVKGSTNLYFGQSVPAADLPWHYIPAWIGITTPVVYSVLFITGLFFVIKNSFASFKSTFMLHSVLFMLFTPVVAIIVLNSSLYDGWRHVFFIYPFFLIIAVYGFSQVFQIIKNMMIKKLIVVITVLSMAYTIIVMIGIHPFQNVYFNVLAGNNLRQRFEMEYWGLSYKQALEYILAHDKSDQIHITAANLPGYLNFYCIPAEDRMRLVKDKDINSGNYFITNFRNHPQDYDIPNSVFQIQVRGEKIMEAFKLR